MINILKNQKETEYQNVIINIAKLNNRKYFDTINKKLNYRMDYTFFNYKTHEDQLFQENHYQIKEYQLDLIKKLLTNEELLFLNKKYFNITDKFILSIQNITID
jgi:nicotinic acid phosphoribosyltransferase